MATVRNAISVSYALRQSGVDVENAVKQELPVLAQMAARTMQRLAAKSSSTLWTSISVTPVDAFTFDIRPGVAYAEYVEDGVKPGGRGLPRFFDPASYGIVEWLKRTAPKGGVPFDRKANRGTAAFQSAMLSLRDRYEGLALHIRARGVKPQPFVAPTAKAMEPVVLSRLDLAVRRALAARPGEGATA